MSTKGDSLSRLHDVDDLLLQIEKQGTPLRIDGPSDTYYVLTVKQLMALLGITSESENRETVPQFTPEDFGLTEADLVAYQARREARRRRVDVDALEPIDPNLEQRLDRINRLRDERPLSEEEHREQEALLQELETAMLRNLETAVK